MTALESSVEFGIAERGDCLKQVARLSHSGPGRFELNPLRTDPGPAACFAYQDGVIMIERTCRNGLERRRARYSDCEKFRYSLEITFGNNLIPHVSPAMVAWVALNPSTATEQVDDPTVLRIKNRSVALGFTSMTMLNLYAYRATDPRDMIEAGYPVGEETDKIIRSVCLRAAKVILCYGNHGQRERVDELFRILDGIQCHALKVSKSGRPSHPLYLPMSLQPEPYDFEVHGGREEAVNGGTRVPHRLIRQGSSKNDRFLGYPAGGDEDERSDPAGDERGES